jgi:hypothetical protein
MLLEITRQASFTGLTINEAGKEARGSEHQWLESILRGLAMGSVWSSSVKLPSDEDVINFAGKQWSDGRPLGFAMPEIWNDEDVKQIEEWCPEVMLCSERSVGDFLEEETKVEEVLPSMPIPTRYQELKRRATTTTTPLQVYGLAFSDEEPIMEEALPSMPTPARYDELKRGERTPIPPL